MADQRENQLTPISTPAYLRCLDSVGNSGLITIEQLLIQKGVLYYKRQLQAPIDLNDIKETGSYYITPTPPVNAPFSYCQLLVFTSSYVTSQVVINSSDADIKIRICWAGTWSEWKQL